MFWLVCGLHMTHTLFTNDSCNLLDVGEVGLARRTEEHEGTAACCSHVL